MKKYRRRLILLAYFPVLCLMILSLIGLFYWNLSDKGISGYVYLLSNQPAPHPLFMVTFYGELIAFFGWTFSWMDRKLKESDTNEQSQS